MAELPTSTSPDHPNGAPARSFDRSLLAATLANATRAVDSASSDSPGAPDDPGAPGALRVAAQLSAPAGTAPGLHPAGSGASPDAGRRPAGGAQALLSSMSRPGPDPVPSPPTLRVVPPPVPRLASTGPLDAPPSNAGLLGAPSPSPTRGLRVDHGAAGGGDPGEIRLPTLRATPGAAGLLASATAPVALPVPPAPAPAPRALPAARSPEPAGANAAPTAAAPAQAAAAPAERPVIQPWRPADDDILPGGASRRRRSGGLRLRRTPR